MAADQNSSHDSGRPPIDPAGSTAPPPPPPGYYPPPPPPPKRGGGIWAKMFASLIGMLLVASIIANVYFGVTLNYLTQGVHTTTYQSGSAKHRIVILPIKGMVDSSMANYVKQSLDLLKDNPPQALILRVDSGGGGVTASDEIRHMLDTFQKDNHIPIVASYGQVAASGAYYLSTGSNYIYAQPTTITGSIGVFAPAMTFGGLLKKVGITPEWVVAKGSPDKLLANDPTRHWTDADRQEIRKFLNADYKRFVHEVLKGRSKSPAKMTQAELDKVDKGRVYTADVAVKTKLVDHIGYLPDAIKKAATLIHTPKGQMPQVDIIEQPTSISVLSLLGATHKAPNLSAEHLRSVMEELMTPKLEYRAMIR